MLRKILRAITQPINNKVKGKIGESKVNSSLNPKVIRKVEHRQINNLIIMDENGKSHQIDHIEIRSNGIFCIETKNYKGWIFGSENQNEWTQSLYTEKHHFMNPLKQNKTHIYYLRKVIGNNYHINSLVVMVQNNADRINCHNVINLKDLNSYLKNYDDDTELTIEEMDSIYNKLLDAQSTLTNKEHIQNVKKTRNDLKQGICPRCEGKLIEKHGKYGTFYGCSNYPYCKFILKNK